MSQSNGYGPHFPAVWPAAIQRLAPQRRWIWWEWRYLGKGDRASRRSWAKVPWTVTGETLKQRWGQLEAGGWGTLEEAVRAASAMAFNWRDLDRHVGGVGWVPVAIDGILFIDLDECLDLDGRLRNADLEIIVDRLMQASAYIERSPSGTGLRAIGLVDVNFNAGGLSEDKQMWSGVGGNAGKIKFDWSGEVKGEIYADTGFVTITGFGGGAEICFGEIADVANDLWKSQRNIHSRHDAIWDPTLGPLNPYILPNDQNHDVERIRNASIEVLRAIVMPWIPNNGGADWEFWKTGVGMPIWAATDGSEEGFELWNEWSAQNEAYNPDVTRAEWDKMETSPPDTVGWGALEILAKKFAARGRWDPVEKKWVPYEYRPAQVVKDWDNHCFQTKRTAQAQRGLPKLPRVEGLHSGLVDPMAGRVDPGLVAAALGLEKHEVVPFEQRQARIQVPQGQEVGGQIQVAGGYKELAAQPMIEQSTEWVKPQINVGLEFVEMMALAEDSILRSGLPVFSRGTDKVMTVTVAEAAPDGQSDWGTERRTTVLGRLTAPSMRAVISHTATWFAIVGKNIKKAQPPRGVAEAMLDIVSGMKITESVYPSVTGVSEIPLLRRDGSVSAAQGYDKPTQRWVAHDAGLRMPEGWQDRVGRRGYRGAEPSLALLDSLLDGFPFVEQLDRAVALSALLTAATRVAYQVAPMHCFRAPTAGTGKSFLVDLIAAIVRGWYASALSASEDMLETEKRLIGQLLAGRALISIDNCNDDVRSELLSQIVERPSLELRRLGSSDMITIENTSTVFINGNNTKPTGDLIRRTLTCRMDARVERPERRVFGFDPFARVMSNRGIYVEAALDVCATYLREGSPGADSMVPFGSYGGWGRVVRGALMWLGWPDVTDSIERAREDDPEVGMLREVLTAMLRRIGANKPITAREIAELCTIGAGLLTPETTAEHKIASDFRDAMVRVAGDRGVVNTLRLGKWLSHRDGRIAGGLRLVQGKAPDHVMCWHVEPITAFRII